MVDEHKVDTNCHTVIVLSFRQRVNRSLFGWHHWETAPYFNLDDHIIVHEEPLSHAQVCSVVWVRV